MGKPARRLGKLANGGRRGTALVETALVLPILLLLAFGVIGVGRVTQARMEVDAVARETARAAAQASDAGSAVNQGLARGQALAQGEGLTNGSLQLALDVGPFARGGAVVARASYTVSFGDLPLLAWAQLRVGSVQREAIDPYRSRWSGGG